MNEKKLVAIDAASRWWPLAALLGLVFLAWCDSTAIWSPADFGLPAAYLEDPSKSDIIAVYTGIKASASGEAAPFSWKTVSRLNAPFTANWTDWPSLDEGHCLTRDFTWYAVVKFAARLGMHRPSALPFISLG